MPGRPGRVNCGVCHRQHNLPSCPRPLIDRLAAFTDEELESELERRGSTELVEWLTQQGWTGPDEAAEIAGAVAERFWLTPKR